MTDPAFRSELDAAIDLSNDGRWKAALKAVNRLVKAYPGEMQPWFERAMVLLNVSCGSCVTSSAGPNGGA